MSLSLYGGKKIADRIDIVYPMNHTISTIYDGDDDFDGKPNPDYNPVLDVNLGNRNAQIVMAALNIEIEDGYFSMNAKEFQARCVAWLRGNIGKPAVEGFGGVASQDENAPLMLDCGIADGYVNRNIQRFSAFASAVIGMGAEVIYGS